MTPKIEKLTRDIDKTRKRIEELTERLSEMERQKTELENTEIVALFRSLDIASDHIPAFVTAMRDAAVLPIVDPLDESDSPTKSIPDIVEDDAGENAAASPSAHLYEYEDVENEE